MDILLFIKSLSPTEVEILKNHLLKTPELLTTKDFLRKKEMSVRLRNLLTDNIETFEYVSEITKHLFFKLPKAGTRSWEEFEKLINQNK